MSYIYAREAIDDSGSIDVVSDFVEIFTKTRLWADDNINVMYLNLFGSDW